MLTHAITTGDKTQNPSEAMFDAVFRRSLNFRVEMSFEEAQQAIRLIDQYNEFEAASVLDALDQVDRLIPRRLFGTDNPNNGSRSFKISVGREGSPVIYVDLYEFGDQDWMTEDSMKLACQEMTLIGKADEADYEISPVVSFRARKTTFRFWWD